MSRRVRLMVVCFTMLLLCSALICCNKPEAVKNSPESKAEVTVEPDKAPAVPPPVGYVLIKAGEFTMGSPETEENHQAFESEVLVTLTHDYFLKATEVTQKEWFTLMNNNPSWASDEGNDDFPVERVNWYDTLAYCNALSRAEGLQECYDLTGCTGTAGTDEYRCPDDLSFSFSCQGYRLPTEAEWEFAARAGSTDVRYGESDAVAWYQANSEHKSHPVSQKTPNNWGLYDMLGNVWEWTWDWSGYYGSNASDPLGPETGTARIGRGGSWLSPGPRFIRATARGEATPSSAESDHGFRVARSAL